MSESKEHKQVKAKVKEIAEELGYRVQEEFESPRRMAFQSYTGKKIIDVWCEYWENRDGGIWGRQIPIEVDYSEYIFFPGEFNKEKGKYISKKYEKYRETGELEGASKFNLLPYKSIRCVMSYHINEAWTVNLSSPYPYHMHIIPFSSTHLIKKILQTSRFFLIRDFNPKIKQRTLTNWM